MSHLTIQQMPTLANPELLTHEECTEELLRTQALLLDGLVRLGDMSQIAHQQAAIFEALIDSHEANDYDAVKLQLQRFAEHRASFKQTKAKVH